VSVVTTEVFETLDSRTRELLELRQKLGPSRRRGWLVRRALLLADVLGLTFAFALAQQLYLPSTTRPGALDGLGEFVAFVVSLPVWVVAAKVYGLYDKDEERTDHSTTDDFAGVFHLITVGTFLLYAVSREMRLFAPQLGKLLVFWILAIASVALLRAAARTYCRRQINYLQNTIIVGAGEVGQRVARKLLNHPEYGINLVGFVDGDPLDRAPGLEHLSVLGQREDLPELIDLLDVERVIVAFSNDHHEEQLELIRNLNALSIQVDIVPRFFDVLNGSVDFHTIEGLPVCSLPPARLSRSSKAVKRGLDLVGAIIGLLALAPLFALIALAIKLDSPGPVFFRQVRVGERKRRFRMWKFRSMIADADVRKSEVAHLNKHLTPGGDPRMFKIDRDPRVTRVGSILRRSSLDELPQLLNVLRGEMSLVGPRPLIVDEARFVHEWGQRRLDLRPGMTGLWQVLGRDEIAFEEMVRLDYRYVTSWSLFADFKLIARTVPLVLSSRSVRRG
jgi:exopolysaccharide biosynthesis polyprenyl glycosylphosphotransferase